MAVVLFLAAASTCFWVYYIVAQQEPGPDNAGLVTISKGATPRAVARILHKSGYIQTPRLFLYYLRFSGNDKKLKYGTYQLIRPWTLSNITRQLTSGKQKLQSVTIQEGLWASEVISLIRKKYGFDSLMLDSLIHSPEFAAQCSIPANSLEGYLFPDTYFMPAQLSESGFLKILTRQFRKVISTLDIHASDVYRKLGQHKWVTLASIVEGEAAVSKEQPLIAGVFYNRYLKGWPLGADPTVRYIYQKRTGPLYVSELNNSSSYNTRKFPGLPPGPINSPGKGALKATLFPSTTPYLFFVAKDNGTREHLFSKTNREHEYFKRLRRKNQNQRR